MEDGSASLDEGKMYLIEPPLAATSVSVESSKRFDRCFKMILQCRPIADHQRGSPRFGGPYIAGYCLPSAREV